MSGELEKKQQAAISKAIDEYRQGVKAFDAQIEQTLKDIDNATAHAGPGVLADMQKTLRQINETVEQIIGETANNDGGGEA